MILPGVDHRGGGRVRAVGHQSGGTTEVPKGCFADAP